MPSHEQINFRPEGPPAPALEAVGRAEQELKEEIRELVRGWLSVYNQEHRDVSLQWTHGKDEDLANCEHDTEYDEVKFCVNVGRVMAELQPSDLSELICHEVAHIPTWPLWEVAMDLLERLASTGVPEPEIQQWHRAIRRAGEYSTTQVHRAVMRASNT